MKILAFLLVIVVSLVITLALSILLGMIFFGGDMMQYVKDGMEFGEGSLPMLQYLQIFNSIGLFLLPSLVFALLAGRSVSSYLAMKIKPSFVAAVIGIAVIMAILPFIHWLASLNAMMTLPSWLSGMESWMLRSEEQARELTDLFLSSSSMTGLALNLFMIAVLPAIGEEFLFRGVLLRLFREWTKSPHFAVLISAFLFSALHLQFYGFLPRFVLGIVLGYLFVWSRSIWVPVIVHLFNNGIAVVGAWYYARNNIDQDIESIGQVDQPTIIFLSFFMVTVMMLIIRFYEHKKRGNIVDASP
jgi:membrane protease YdiL (CAAX protease family)